MKRLTPEKAAEAYHEYIQTLPSALDGEYAEWIEALGEGRNPACHVRRAGESGTSYKAPFVEIPLTHQQHWCQSFEGELTCLARYAKDADIRAALFDASPDDAVRMAKDWFDQQKRKYYARWLEETPEGRAWADRRTVEEMA
jgi:hypothetical protein